VQTQRNPNGWSCLPTAFAIVLDTPVSKIIAEIGHDGSEIAWPQFPDPLCRRGFHIQELILVAFYKGKSVTPYEAIPLLVSRGGEPIDVPFRMPPKSRLGYIMSHTHGVITGATLDGRPHAVAWDGEQVLDPRNETKYSIEGFLLETYWLIK
jgi:hypothetical protein